MTAWAASSGVVTGPAPAGADAAGAEGWADAPVGGTDAPAELEQALRLREGGQEARE